MHDMQKKKNSFVIPDENNVFDHCVEMVKEYEEEKECNAGAWV